MRQTQVKVDLTICVKRHIISVDYVLVREHESNGTFLSSARPRQNSQVNKVTVQPLIKSVFDGNMATKDIRLL